MLTSSYHAIYGAGEENEELILVVAPLSANAEIETLYKAGIIDYETAMYTKPPSKNIHTSKKLTRCDMLRSQARRASLAGLFRGRDRIRNGTSAHRGGKGQSNERRTREDGESRAAGANEARKKSRIGANSCQASGSSEASGSKAGQRKRVMCAWRFFWVQN